MLVHIQLIALANPVGEDVVLHVLVLEGLEGGVVGVGFGRVEVSVLLWLVEHGVLQVLAGLRLLDRLLLLLEELAYLVGVLQGLVGHLLHEVAIVGGRPPVLLVLRLPEQ